MERKLVQSGRKGQSVDVSVHPTTGAVIIRPGIKYYEDGEVTDAFLSVAEGARSKHDASFRELAKCADSRPGRC